VAKKERKILKPKAAIAAVVAGCALFGAVYAGVQVVLPAQDVHDSNRNYGYVYSGAKSSSVAFNTSADADDSLLLFGSSELSTPASSVPQVPTAVFGQGNYGVDLTYVGEAYDQSLWHSMAAGAYAGSVDNKKCAIIVSPGWFEDGGVDNTTFGLRFSYGLYRAFCDNPDISDASKAYLVKRLHEQGIDEMTINAGLRTMPQDYLNDAVLATMDDLKVRNELRSVRKGGLDQSQRGDEEPLSFDELRAQALADAQAASTNNDWGIDDSFYSNNIAGNEDRLTNLHADETYSHTPEFNDFNFLLKVMREVGFEPLVIISPIHGDFYDMEGVTASVRHTLYRRIAEICDEHGVACADLTSHEYEKYFLHDIVHFGGPGWVAVEEAIYDHATK